MAEDRGVDQEEGLAVLLAEADGRLKQAGRRFAPYAVRAGELAARLREERFHLAVLGQFKRGKSSLINALLGGEFLPASSVPMTALPTVIGRGNTRWAKITFADGRTDEGTFSDDSALEAYLSRFVAEQANPGNRLGVNQVDVEYPASLLAGGITLIDTPGIGSTFQHNTDTTLQFLSQCDAALFVVSADPPITAAEVAFLQAVQQHVRRFFFVLNKADYLSASEREVVAGFLRQVLQEKAGVAAPIPVYLVSARQALSAKKAGDRNLLAESGLSLLEETLIAFFRQEKQAVLTAAIGAKLAAVLQEALLELELTVRALELPVDELTTKQALLAQKLTELTAEQRLAGDLLAGDRKRTLAFLEEQAAALRKKAGEYLDRIVAEQLGGYRPGLEQEVQAALAETVPTFFDRELKAASDRFGEYIAGVLAPHQQRAEMLVSSVRQAAASIFALDYQVTEQATVFYMKRQPYWVKEKWKTGLGGIPHTWLESLLPASVRLARIRKRLEQQAEELVLQNVENLRWALWQNAETTFHSFGETLKTRLLEAVSGTSQAVAAATAQKQGQVEAAKAELVRLQEEAEALRQLVRRAAALCLSR
ncbi:MAG TPA: dynamin family protein [Methylomusa anaerophila]|uniref:Bacterial dynamin-like protein n=1 Tax=Methylomusa anaerophila TaxID=1930071 RepID=A0A348AJA2_9FIRM|nr:dynamin family protein [Methylomusa anaerophila]BBB91150.1 bacterial dynamin-like protein [Methylomusa anaerophila]HML89027.1 dynamin family protein [Methylomusa anaerophila]